MFQTSCKNMVIFNSKLWTKHDKTRGQKVREPGPVRFIHSLGRPAYPGFMVMNTSSGRQRLKQIGSALNSHTWDKRIIATRATCLNDSL